MEMTKPRFRADLVARPLEEDGIRFVDVTDPNSGATFRFYDVEYSIACAMDGAKDLQGLVEWTRTELGIETNTEELTTVVSTLAELGYLEAVHEAVSGRAGGEPSLAPSVDDGAGDEFRADHPEELTREVPALSGIPAAEPEEVTALRPSPAQAAAARAASAASGADQDETSFAGLADGDPPTPPPAAGPAEGSRLRPQTHPPAGFDDEPTNLPPPRVAADDDEEDVAVDLGAHLSLSKDEVKEAVRASQVMEVPAIPKDLGAALESEGKDATENAEKRDAAKTDAATEKAEPRGAAKDDAAERREAAKAGAPKTRDVSVAEANEPKPGLRADPKDATGKGATALPKGPPVSVTPVAAAPAPEPAASSGGSKLLVGLLLLLGLAAAGYYYLNRPAVEPAPEPEPRPSPSGQVTPASPSEPVAPQEPVARLTKAEPITVEVKASAAGKLEWVVEDGATVAMGDAVAKLEGAKKAERELANAKARLAYYEDRLAKAQAAGPAATEAAQAKVAEKRDLVTRAQKQLDALTMTAPAGGKIQILVGVGAAVNVGDPVVRIGGGEPSLAATFDLGPAASPYRQGDSCRVALAQDRDRIFDCTVESLDGSRVTVRLAPATAAQPDDIVVLLPLPRGKMHSQQ